MFTVVIYFSLHRNSITFRNIYMTTSVFMLAIKAYLYFHPTLTTNYKNRMERRYIVKYILFIVHSRILHYDAFLNVNIKYTKILSYKYTRLPKNFDILIYSRKAKSYCNPQTHLIFAR